MKMVRHAPELEKRPLFKGNNPPEAPVSKGIANLTSEDGPRLQLMTRVRSKEVLQAVAIANIYTNIYGSKYVKGRINEILRMNVSIDGQGRRDIIDIVEAGGTLPPNTTRARARNRLRLSMPRGMNDGEEPKRIRLCRVYHT